ncbi:S8 family serine peptidase [Streptomyces acidicola]|uniref:S8 family serine peptidase n=1 Tax=Streptomyces acidicola TaxID=2596892 RepID=A0A5N8WWQ8_9ACTN|nr:S8 family serine peptidase [Streptomyces acidicola]MPY51256.1 S8 family serine peptidase [Streptomyces acidicola]
MTLPPFTQNNQPPPSTVFGYISARSREGALMAEAGTFESAVPFQADQSTRNSARGTAEAAGLTVTAESEMGLTVSGPPQAFEELTGGRIESYDALQQVESGRVRYVTHLDIVGEGQPEDRAVGAVPGADAIDAVVLEQPRAPHRLFPPPQPPSVAKFHLRLPGDVAMLVGATAAHHDGQVGSGVPVAMTDTGQFAHPYFTLHGYDIRPAVVLEPGTNPAEDPVGHGTGESANIFAVAPGATLRPYRASNSNGLLTSAVAAFVRAKSDLLADSDSPGVMTNSWGGDDPYPPPGPPPAAARVWALEIRDAVERNITVVFSAGNGQFSIEAQVPGVIAAGGVFAGPGLDLQASDYASGYVSPWFQNVTVPTVCGLVGKLPRAQYLMLPVPPGCEIDIEESQAGDGLVPDPGDGTRPDDGWALFSGTSAAAPQVAGAAAVLLGAQPRLTPGQVAEALAATATDVTVGHGHPRFGNQAGPGFDAATGPGLINVSAALAYARQHF